MRLILLITVFCSALQAAPIQMDSVAVRYNQGNLSILDQQKLPAEEEWIDVETTEQMVEIIRALKVRGAPLIGISAALSLSQLAERGASFNTIQDAAVQLKNSRPTAVNLAIYIERILKSMQQRSDFRQAVIETAAEIFQEDVALCERIGIAGAALIEPGERILTICNTGSLATAGLGTALGVIKTAHAQGKNIHVYACETRPLLQGGRLTAWELERSGIPYTLICDSMAATLMREGKIDRVLVGADRIAANGDFANKIGTYSLAVLAHHHQIPFHVVAPYTTIDPACPNGEAIVIEQRKPDEVRGAAGSFGSVIWSPKEAPVFNPAFDVTPAELVSTFILDAGSLDRASFLLQVQR
ncbi:MAG: S-methyl-5-thioribose-1-phosphate isomerase [Parachlamydiales bacterium]|nr:S-methyl-5-thioribose-1-phosphate isomerase [Candidatus Acheromyda pituitae]